MEIKPTDAELEILQEMWQLGPCTVRQINDRMNEKKEVGYTTSLKLMQIMLEKGLVSREAAGRSHIYTAQVTENATRGSLLKNFVDSTFRGSAMQLVMQALGNHSATSEELDDIKALIQKMEKNKDA